MLRLARTPGSSYCRRLPGCTSTAPASRPKVSFAACALLPLRALASASALLLVQIACRHASASPSSHRHASASLCLAVARAPLPMHLVIHLVRQIESPPLPPEAADDETSNRVPVVVVVLRLLRPYLCVLASALAACAPLSVRPRLYILLYILFVKLKLPRSLPKRRMTRPRIEFP